MKKDVPPKLRQQFLEYVKDAPQAQEHLEFILENMRSPIVLDGSKDSLVALERFAWELKEKEVPQEYSDIVDPDHFAKLLGQYFGTIIIDQLGARWIQNTDRNPQFGFPCLDGFGNAKWERIYPLDTSLHLFANSKSMYSWVRERRVFAYQFEQAHKVWQKAEVHGIAVPRLIKKRR
jgi:hypothetical protein